MGPKDPSVLSLCVLSGCKLARKKHSLEMGREFPAIGAAAVCWVRSDRRLSSPVLGSKGLAGAKEEGGTWGNLQALR